MSEPSKGFDHYIELHRKLKAKREEIENEYKAKDAPYREAYEKLRAHLLSMLQATGQDSAKTAAGTVYSTVKFSASLENPDEFMRHVIGSQAWELLDRKANTTACADYATMNGALPPGVKMTSRVDIGVRAPTKPRVKGAPAAPDDQALAAE